MSTRVLLVVMLAVPIGCGQKQARTSDEHSGHAPPTAAIGLSEHEQTPSEAAEHASHGAPATDEHAEHAEHQGHSAGAAHEGEAKPGELAPGRAAVLLDSARRQALGVKVDHVARQTFTRNVQATGIVRIDERLQSHVHVKFEGFVERVFVNFVGRRVRKGEPLLSVYSPELLAAESELAQAYADRDRPRTGAFAAADRAQGEALIRAGRARLALLDVPDEELKRLERTREPRRALTIASPIAGTVIDRNVLDGMRVMPDTTLMVIADLRSVWVVTNIFEHDLGSIQVGDHAHVSFAGNAAPERDGTVGFISPTLDETTRTAKIRIELKNQDGAIRPGLFAEVTIHVEAGERLGVPASAIIDTGARQIAFVETEPGRFEPRIVKTGARAGDVLEVLAGLSEGETVAVSAQFLLDSESQIRGGPTTGAHSH
jgi:Cu(I)/Ag(I) efflux system membrane fusion protein